MKSSGKLPDSLRSPHTDMNAHGRLCVFKRQNSKRDSFLANAMERLAKPEAEPAAARRAARARSTMAQLLADVRIAASASGASSSPAARADGASGSDLAGTAAAAGTRGAGSREVVDVEAAARSAPNWSRVLAGRPATSQLQLSNEVADRAVPPAARSNYGLPIRGEICQDPVMARVMMSRRQSRR